MELYDGRSKIIKLFLKNSINPSDFPYNAKSEELEEIEQKQESKQESEQELIKTTGESVKRKKKKERKRRNMPNLEKEALAAQRKNQNGQGLKILTLYEMISRLPISLA